MTTFKIVALGRNDSASGKSRETTYTFVALPVAGGYGPFRRPQDIAGAIVLSRAGGGQNAADRHSATLVEVDIPDGTVIKTVVKENARSKTGVEILRGGCLEGCKYVGASKNAAGGWDSVVEIDGARVTIAG